ncbi:MAG: peptide deformylase [Gammaproteobacteria bacterium]|nr:peptide deformylase [Gammaproteobacteria bacterium]
MSSGPADILLMGDPRLREASRPVDDVRDPVFTAQAATLAATLAAFREAHGFGRAVSAPQIGVSRRFICVNLDGNPRTLVNPEITWRAPETFTLWDDCMSFPYLLVRVARHASVSVRFLDETGSTHQWEALDRATSELLQHEIDHLDGVLAVDRALDRDSLVSREVFEADPERFAEMVDYVIGSDS